MKSWRTRLLNFVRLHKAETVSALVGLVLMNLILFAKAYHGSAIDPQKAGEFGDFVGGYFGPIFTLVGVILVIKTFKAERLSSEMEAFESKYFELLKMHHDNVAEIKLSKSSGRKVFVLILREWREALRIIRDLAGSTGQNLTQRELLEITYCCLFYGVGPNSSRMLQFSLSKFDAAFIGTVESKLNDGETKTAVQQERSFAFTPFEGHQSRLGHYYRHLYQLVRYVDEKKLPIVKYEYMKTIRAQLSTHEQALLLLNSLAPMGQGWWSNHLIDTYRMVQNIPRGFFIETMELSPEEMFGEGYFEWSDLDTFPIASLERPFTRI